MLFALIYLSFELLMQFTGTICNAYAVGRVKNPGHPRDVVAGMICFIFKSISLYILWSSI